MTGPYSLLFHISWLGDVKQNSVSDSSELALKAKIHASRTSKGMKDKMIAKAHKFNGWLHWKQVNMYNITTKKQLTSEAGSLDQTLESSQGWDL